MLHRREDSPLWAIPGGKIELNESVEQCLKRELKEELGIRVSATRLLGLYTDPAYLLSTGNQVYRVFLIVFLCSITEGSPNISSETTDYQWFQKKEIHSIKAFPLVKKIVLQAFDGEKEVFFD